MANQAVISSRGEDRPPPLSTGPLGWARANLFNSWVNAIITIVCLYVIGVVLYDGLQWFVLRAVWTGEASACAKLDGTGACWAVLAEKGRLVIFGSFPYNEQWRPLVALALYVLLVAYSIWRSTLNRTVLSLWLGYFVLAAILMAGGVFGLSPVSDTDWGGLPLTVMLTTISLAGAFPLSLALALGRRSDLPIIRYLAVGYIELIRGVPLITVLFMATVLFPLFLPNGVTIDKLLSAQVGMLLFTAAYLAEVVRGGLQALPRGQYEAADALGLSYWQKMRLVILPQALRLVIPPLVSTFISAFKNTTLVTIVSLFDLVGSAKAAINDPLWRSYAVEIYVAIGVIYFVVCFVMSRYSQVVETRLARGARR